MQATSEFPPIARDMAAARAEHGQDARATMAPLRVLFALPGLHRVARGAEVAFEEIARGLAADENFRVTLIGSGPARDGERYAYKRCRCIKREFFEKWPSIPYLRGHYVYEEITFTPGLLRAYSPDDYDVTLTCGYPYVNWLLRGRRSDRSARKPRHVFVTQNGDWMARAKNWEFRHFGCDGLVCINPEYYERHQNTWPSALIPNGIDVNMFSPGPADRAAFGLPADAPVVLMVSALISSKHVLEGVRAAAGVPGAHFVIAGDGELRQQVDDLGRELLGDRFHRMTLPRERMPGLYRCADVVLHMSTDEPFGNVYLEGLATGLPVVGHDWAVTRWILEDAGILVDTQDGAAVTAALREGLTRRSTAEVESRRRMVERRFAWTSVARQYGEFLRRICRD